MKLKQGELFTSTAALVPGDAARSPEFAISLTQPWASLVALRQKLVETRSWYTRHRGPIAIHAAKGFPRECQELCRMEPFRTALGALGPERLPRGAILAVAELDACWRFQGSDDLVGHAHAANEADFGDYSPGRYGLGLARIVALTAPVPAKGALGLWRMPNELRAFIAAQIVQPDGSMAVETVGPTAPA